MYLYLKSSGIWARANFDPRVIIRIKLRLFIRPIYILIILALSLMDSGKKIKSYLLPGINFSLRVVMQTILTRGPVDHATLKISKLLRLQFWKEAFFPFSQLCLPEFCMVGKSSVAKWFQTTCHFKQFCMTSRSTRACKVILKSHNFSSIREIL